MLQWIQLLLCLGVYQTYPRFLQKLSSSCTEYSAENSDAGILWYKIVKLWKHVLMPNMPPKNVHKMFNFLKWFLLKQFVLHEAQYVHFGPIEFICNIWVWMKWETKGWNFHLKYLDQLQIRGKVLKSLMSHLPLPIRHSALLMKTKNVFYYLYNFFHIFWVYYMDSM